MVQVNSVLNIRLHQRFNQVLGVHIPGAACNDQVNIRVMDQVHGLQQNIQAFGLFDLSKKQKIKAIFLQTLEDSGLFGAGAGGR